MLGRLAIVLTGGALALAVVVKGLAVHFAQSDPSVAAYFAPFDARTAVAAAKAEMAAGAPATSPEVRRLTAEALARDPTLTPAIEIRALEAGSDRQPAREAQLFHLSSVISRRSLPTRLWLIQRAVERGDVGGALEHFDIALRTSTAAPSVLFPVLAGATADRGLTAPIARLLDRPGDWRLAFLHYAITEAHAGPGSANVVMRMRDRRAIVDDKVDQTLIGELVSEHQFAMARRVRDTFGPPADGGDAVADPHFANASQPYPFGWDLIQNGAAGALRTRSDGQAALGYQESPGGGGAVAAQLVTLAPGNYRLETITARSASDPAAQPYWTLTCAEAGGSQIALLSQPQGAGAAASMEFAVPQGCTGQWLALVLRPSDEAELTGAVRSIDVSPR